MLISELVNELQKVRLRQGDVEVVFKGLEGHHHSVDGTEMGFFRRGSYHPSNSDPVVIYVKVLDDSLGGERALILKP